MSAMLTTSMNSMKNTVQRLKREDFRLSAACHRGESGPISPSFAGRLARTLRHHDGHHASGGEISTTKH